MKVGRIGRVSPDGNTVLYDAKTQEMVSLPLPILEKGLDIEKGPDGRWHVSVPKEMYEVSPKLESESVAHYEERVMKQKLHLDSFKEMEDFYYATRDFLSYKNYEYVARRFPNDCYQRFLENPFYLTDIHKYNEEAPVCSVPKINSHIILSTFEARLNEMRYVCRYVLEQEENAGNTWVPLETFKKKVEWRLREDGHPLLTGNVVPYLRYFDQDFVILSKDGEEIVGLMGTHEMEQSIYNDVAFAVSLNTPYPGFYVDEEHAGGASERQREAVNRLITKGGRLGILTGGPGTGKTTTLKLIVNEINRQYPGTNIFLLSPTGRAARRIQEVFGNMDVRVSTVHKFIGFGMDKLTANILQTINSAGLIIVDESSMLDLDIFKRLVSYVNFKKTKLILVGDVDQLPSIGAGNVLHDLISLGVHTERLTENFRSNGPVIQNGMKINSGDPILSFNRDFELIPYPKCTSDYFAGMDGDAEIVITPYRKDTRIGNTENVNLVAQARIFEGARMTGEKFQVGDIVIMMRTNYKNGYCNGESGRLVTHFPNGDWLVSFDDGRCVLVSRESDMDLGYAGTVHKCQGSEYDSIVIDIPAYSPFVTRRMLYTAVTRAKRKVTIHSTKEILRKVIMNNPEEIRHTWLSTFEPFMILD